MKLIVGLGNPGKKYEATRHNIGFLALEYLRVAWDFPAFRAKASFQAECSEGTVDDEKIILARPRTFMNRSGEAVRNILHFYKIEPRDIVVIHDDLDILRGDVRESFGSRSGGHNGVGDIIETLGTKDFLRFRVGIKNTLQNETENQPIDTAVFVLEPFSKDERALIEKTFPEIVSRLRSWIREKRER